MNKVKLFGIGMCAALATIFLTGCGGGKAAGSAKTEGTEKAQEVHLAAVIGSHANAPRPNLGLIEDMVYEACYTYGSVTLICDDGDPYTLVIDIPEQKSGLSRKKYKQIANEATSQILSAASQMQAKTDEVDTLKAIQLGARSLESVQSESSDVEVVRQMVILDSCLSTTGALSYSEHNLNNIDPDDIVAQLEEMNEIPVLDDTEVTVYTCGDTAGTKQKVLTEANRKTLREAWKSILEAGNAEVNMKDNLPLSSTYDEESLPEVTPVSVVRDSVDIKDEKDIDNAFADGGVISFDEKSIAFCEGTAELLDKETAKQALCYVAEYMEANPDFKLLVCGTTARWGEKEYCKNLSNDRASVICQLLTDEFGIDKSRVQSVGVGYSFDDFYTYDQTADGELDDTIAPVNRSVKLIDLESDTAARVLSME